MRRWTSLRSWLRGQGRRRPPGRALQLEQLELRTVPATAWVTTTTDNSWGDNLLSLREAMAVLTDPPNYALLDEFEQLHFDLTESFGDGLDPT